MTCCANKFVLYDMLRSGTLNFTEFVNMFTDYGKITSSSPARKDKVGNVPHPTLHVCYALDCPQSILTLKFLRCSWLDEPGPPLRFYPDTAHIFDA